MKFHCGFNHSFIPSSHLYLNFVSVFEDYENKINDNEIIQSFEKV